MSDLLDWWRSEFTAKEQDYILAKYQPLVMGAGSDKAKSPVSNIIAPDGSLGLIGSLAALATCVVHLAKGRPTSGTAYTCQER